MAKLFKTTEVTGLDVPVLSLEQQLEYIMINDVIAAESFGMFFASVKDKLRRVIASVTYNDTMTADTLSYQSRVKEALKKVQYKDIAVAIMSKPEHFKGYLIDLLADLNTQLRSETETVYKSIEQLKYVISYYMNDYKPNMISIDPNLDYFKKLEKEQDKSRLVIQKYFKSSDSSQKAMFKEIYKSMKDFEQMFELFKQLDNLHLETHTETLNRRSEEISDLIDNLIQLNIDNGGKLINSDTKKNLALGTYAVAKQIETVGYFISTLLLVHGSHKNNMERLIEFSEKY